MFRARISGLTGAAVLACLLVAQPAAAAIVYSNNFTNSSCAFTCSLTGGSVLTAPSGQKFLGNLGQGSTTATLTITGLNTNTPHTGIQIGFTLDVVGSMDGTGPTIQGGGAGDFFTVGYSGSGSGTVFNQAFANYDGGNKQTYPTAGAAPTTGASSINALQYTGFPDSGNGVQDSEYNFNAQPGNLGAITFSDSGNALTITFTSLSNEALSNEFYGIDNLVVQTTGTGFVIPPVPADVPEPAPVLLMGLGLVALLAQRRRRG